MQVAKEAIAHLSTAIHLYNVNVPLLRTTGTGPVNEYIWNSFRYINFTIDSINGQYLT
jgi:hypothetical protein